MGKRGKNQSLKKKNVTRRIPHQFSAKVDHAPILKLCVVVVVVFFYSILPSFSFFVASRVELKRRKWRERKKNNQRRKKSEKQIRIRGNKNVAKKKNNNHKKENEAEEVESGRCNANESVGLVFRRRSRQEFRPPSLFLFFLFFSFFFFFLHSQDNLNQRVPLQELFKYSGSGLISFYWV